MRVGIVGAGTMGAMHAAAWAQTGAKLVGVHSLRGGPELAHRYGAKVFERFEELLQAVDVADLCVPTDLHPAMTVQAAEAGKHVVCEKPLALTMADGEAMIAACERAGVRLFIAMVVRFFPQYRAAQQLVADGRLGALGVLRLRRAAYQPHKEVDNWFLDEARSGGMVVDLMIHDFDYARWLAGPVTRIYAQSARARVPSSSGDYALVTLRFASGAMAIIEGGWANPPGVFRTGFDLAGTAGLIEWSSDDTATIRTFLQQSSAPAAAARPERSEGVGLPLAPLLEDPYTTQIKHVYRAITTGEPFAVTPQDSLEALRLALAARESLQTGRVVKL